MEKYLMTIDIDSQKYIENLEKALKEYHESKLTDDKVQTIYTKGFCKGMIYVMKNLGMINEEDLKRLVIDTEFDVPSIYRAK